MSFEEVVYVVDVIHYWWRHPAQLEWQMAASQDVLKSDTSSLSDTPRASERPLVKQQDLFAWPPDEVTDDH